MLLHDDSHQRYQKACLKAGIAKEVLATMKDEPDDRLVQDTGCIALKWITQKSPETQKYLAEHDVFALINHAIEKFVMPDMNMPAFPVVSSCAGALLNFA